MDNKNLKSIAKINEVAIMIVEDGEKYVPIKPICDALGIDVEGQRKKIKDDEILSSTAELKSVVANDKKERKMQCLPYRYIFGWLFTINPKNVKSEAKKTVLKYRKKCYDALYDHFTDSSEFLEQKEVAVNKCINEVSEAKASVDEAKKLYKEAENNLKTTSNITIEEWKESNRQLTIEFQDDIYED